MSPTTQIRLFCGLAAVTFGLALLGGLSLKGGDGGKVAVEGAIGWLSAETPDQLDLQIHLVNFDDRPDEIIGVASTEEFAATLCRHSPVKCGPGASAALGSGGELLLGKEGEAYITLATLGRPFREGEVTLIELEMASGKRLPVDVLVRRR